MKNFFKIFTRKPIKELPHDPIWEAYHVLVTVRDAKQPTKYELYQSIEEAIGYLGDALE